MPYGEYHRYWNDVFHRNKEDVMDKKKPTKKEKSTKKDPKKKSIEQVIYGNRIKDHPLGVLIA